MFRYKLIELFLSDTFWNIIDLLTRGHFSWWEAWGGVLEGGGVLEEDVVLLGGEAPGVGEVLGGRGVLNVRGLSR